MNELIENTLHIISKISLSKKGYLLQLSEQNHKVLKIWGGKREDFALLNDVLFNLYISEGIDTDKVASLPSVTNLLNKKSESFLFIKEIINYSERNQVIYILLFFSEANAFTNECKDRIVSILAILSHQVEEWIEQRSENLKLSSSEKENSEEDDKIFEDWENRFNLLMETSSDLIFMINHSGKIILINKTGRDSLEYSADELKGRYFIDLIEQEDASAATAYLNQALLNNMPVKFKTSLCSKFEKVFPFEINCKTVTRNGEVLGLLAIGKDLSEKRKNETELQKLKPRLVETDRLLKIERARVKPQKVLIEELNRLKYDFISNISHEFRTTLASIIGFSETIESDPNLPEEMKIEFNRIIMSEGKRLAKLINDVLDASKVKDGYIVINKTTLEVLILVQDVINANFNFASGKNIQITFDHPTEEIFIEADRENIYQVINALINNAIKFTGEFGRVKVIVNNLFREVEIIVSDTGVGIPEEDLPYIFQRFYRISRPRSDIPSIGVGLVFVKQIIDLHKGLITVQSEVGGGTTFLVKLPKSGKIEKK